MTGVDGGVIADFVAEAGEGLDMAVEDVLSLERGPDREAIDRIFRVVHTIKGTAGMLGFAALAGFVHSLEDVCADIRSGQRGVDRRTADSLLRCLDLMRTGLDRVGTGRREDVDYSQGAACLRALRASAEGRPPTLQPDCAPAQAHASGGAGGLPRPPGMRKDCKTLIVEDDFVSRKVLHSFLSGFSTCCVAKDGSEAIQAVTESYLGPGPEPFSLIFMDVMLPIIDGLRATKAIRALERARGAGYTHPATKIVVVTAVEDPGALDRAIHECGADLCLAKPLDLAELRRIIEGPLFLPRGPVRRPGAEEARGLAARPTAVSG